MFYNYYTVKQIIEQTVIKNDNFIPSLFKKRLSEKKRNPDKEVIRKYHRNAGALNQMLRNKIREAVKVQSELSNNGTELACMMHPGGQAIETQLEHRFMLQDYGRIRYVFG